MQIRSLVVAMAAIPGTCLASGGAAEARVVNGSVPVNIQEHLGALKKATAGQEMFQDVPMLPKVVPAVECGSGTTITWEKIRKGKSFVADSSGRSVVVIFLKDRLNPGDERTVELGRENDFLYIAVEHAGSVCAGYAEAGAVMLNVAADGSISVNVDSSVALTKVRGGKSCAGGNFSLSFVAENEDQVLKCPPSIDGRAPLDSHPG